MSFTLGIYDVFTYAIPGASYLALISYVLTRLHWLDATKVLHSNTTALIIGAVLASYLVGHISWGLGRATIHAMRIWQKDMAYAREEFVRRVPAAKDRSFVHANRSTLVAAIEINEMEPSLEIARLRATAIMLSNVAPAFMLAVVVSIVEAITGNSPAFTALSAVVLFLAAAGSLWNSARLSYWADLKTLELAFWIPKIDEAFIIDHPKGSPRRVPRQPKLHSQHQKRERQHDQALFGRPGRAKRGAS
jgi:hypothetical protein